MNKEMYCSNCGEKLSSTSKFCKSCGNKVQETIGTNNVKMGWSDRINDPAFKRYNRNSVLWKFIFGMTLCLVAFFGFTYIGPKKDMPESEALLVGTVIGGMFFLITMGSIIKEKARKKWSGVIVDKKSCMRTRSYNDSEGRSRREEYETFSVYAKDDKTGKVREIIREEGTTRDYDYWNIGDKVKYHAIGNNGLEKYDKTKDKISFCLACNYINDIENDKCEMCGCPILK